MIDNNIIKFGYGTIAVGSTNAKLSLTWIKPPQEVGETLQGKEYNTLQTIEFEIDYDIFTLQKMIDNITEVNCTIEFRGYTLDFSNYNTKSIDVCKRHIKSLISNYAILLAA